MNIYKEYIPYTYLIGWSKHQKFYYGRRTAKNCHPDELWVKYFTSSKYVGQFRKKHGEPDIIQIRRTFPGNPTACRIWESKVLERLDAQNHSNFLNERNGDNKWDTTGKVTVKDEFGNTFSVFNDDPKYLSGDFKSIQVGKFPAKDKSGNCFQITFDDPRFVSGELSHPVKGRVTVKDEFGNTSSVEKNDQRISQGILVHHSCGTITVKDKTGNCFRVPSHDPRFLSGEFSGNRKGKYVAISTITGENIEVCSDDPRWKTGEIVGKLKGKTSAKIVSSGETFCASIDDPRWKTGEIVGINKGRIPNKTQCPNCKQFFDPGNYKQYHGDKCKKK